MAGVELGDVTARLTLTPDDPDHSPVQYILAELRTVSLSATRRVFRHYASGFADLAAFFEDLAANWRGWPGVRGWESLEHELRIEARHDGHIRLRVQLVAFFDEVWSATAELTLEPGEQLTRVAEGLRDLAGR